MRKPQTNSLMKDIIQNDICNLQKGQGHKNQGKTEVQFQIKSWNGKSTGCSLWSWDWILLLEKLLLGQLVKLQWGLGKKVYKSSLELYLPLLCRFGIV